MKQVRKGLFIGDRTAALKVLSTSNHHITHVLSLISSNALTTIGKPLLLKDLETLRLSESLLSLISASAIQLELSGHDFKVIRMSVPWNDTEDENILDRLEACLEFIDHGRKEGTVLVHCLAGISRSAAAVTAYLMKSERLSLQGALASLREVSESACPNDGFLVQLKMFEDMGYRVDRDSSIYKMFHVKKLGEAYEKGDKIEHTCFAADPTMAVFSSLSEGFSNVNIQKQPNQMADLFYRCRKCRRMVVSQQNILTHSQGIGDASFKKNKKDADFFDARKVPECTSIFVEPMQWMTTVQEGAVLGKLSCASCDARLGNFNWSGIRCSCGAWVVPAFQLHKSRIDADGF